jgi:putative thioredoxin
MMAQSAWIVNVEDSSFEREVIERSREVPVVVDFWAPWCGPCRALAPVLEKLVGERQGEVILAKVNVDEAQETAARFNISSIPAVIAFKSGEPFLDFIGLLPEPHVREFLDRLVPTPAERLARQALALETSKPDDAEKLYRQALDSDRNLESATIGLARVLIERGKDAEAKELLENVAVAEPLAAEAERLAGIVFLRELAKPFGTESEARRRFEAKPEDAQAAYELGCVLAAAGRYSEALELLLAAAQRDANLGRSAVREAMVKIFQIIGVRSALADEYRDKLTALLY